MRRPTPRKNVDDARTATGWVYSPRFRCVGFEWSIFTNDPALVDWVTYLYEACLDGEPGPAREVFTLSRQATSDTGSVSVYRNDQAILHAAGADLAIAHLVWHVNRGVVEEAGKRLLLHAAAAERDRRVLLVAGPEGSGKSTLVAALVRAGLQYVTDETVAVEVPATTIAPYPKPIALDRRSLRALGNPIPAASSTLEGVSEQDLVPPQAIRPMAVAEPGGAPRLLVLPSYRPGSGAAARPIARPDAAVALAEQAFNFRAYGPGRLDAITAVVGACGCYHLDVGELDAACGLVIELFEQTARTR
jgi:energy-coupling factor transporter ATP-binding protein EcfA2